MIRTLLWATIIFSFSTCIPQPKVSIVKIGHLLFHRSFAGLENWSQAKLDSVSEENPIGLFNPDKSDEELKLRLIKAGLIINDRLELSKLESIGNDSLKLIGRNKNEILVKAEFDTALLRQVLRIDNNAQHEKFILECEHQVTLVQMNLYKNKYNEIIVMEQSYVSNNDLYFVIVYKVKQDE